MALTSHAFHVLKDVQSFAAALVAFAAAGITLFVQRKIAENQSSVTLKIADESRKEQRKKDLLDEHRRKMAFSTQMEASLLYIGPSLSRCVTEITTLINYMEKKQKEMFTSTDSPLLFKPFTKHKSIIDAFERVVGDKSDLKLLDSHLIEIYYKSLMNFALADQFMELISSSSEPAYIPKSTAETAKDSLERVVEYNNSGREQFENCVKNLRGEKL